jgi:hypothetical protein
MPFSSRVLFCCVAVAVAQPSPFLQAQAKTIGEKKYTTEINAIMSNLRDIWIAAGRPGVAKLRDAAKRQGVAVTTKEAQDFVRGQEASQVFAAPPSSSGKVTSPELNHTWQADLIDYTAKIPHENGGYRFALVVTDIFSRKTYTENLTNKEPETVTKAYQRILTRAGAKPKQITTDSGKEFKGAFDAFLEESGTTHAMKEQMNHLAVVDASIKTLKDIMKKELTDNKSESWTKALPKAATSLNSNSHPALMNSAPNDVKGSAVLQYELEKKAGEDMMVNAKIHEARVEKLIKAGAFRLVLPRSTWVRAGQPRYGDKVYTLDGISGQEAIATDGTTVLVRDVLPVPSGSKDTVVPRTLRGGRQTRDQESKAILQKYATILKRALDEPISLQKAGMKLRAQAGFSEAMVDAKIMGVGALKRFLDLFPDFAVEGRAPKATVRLVVPEAPPVVPSPAPVMAIVGQARIRLARLPGKGNLNAARF